MTENTSTTQSKVTTNTVTSSTVSRPVQTTQPSRKWSPQYIIGAVILALILVGSALGFYLMNQNQDIRQQASGWCTGRDQCPGGWNWGGGEDYCSPGLKYCTQGSGGGGGGNTTPSPSTGGGGGGGGGGSTCSTPAKNCSVTCKNGRTFSDACPATFASCGAWQSAACDTVGSEPGGSTGGGGGTTTCTAAAKNCSTTCANGRTFSDACPSSFASCNAWASEACASVGSTSTGGGGTGGTGTGACTPGQRTTCGTNGCSNGRQQICQPNGTWGVCVNSDACLQPVTPNNCTNRTEAYCRYIAGTDSPGTNCFWGDPDQGGPQAARCMGSGTVNDNTNPCAPNYTSQSTCNNANGITTCQKIANTTCWRVPASTTCTGNAYNSKAICESTTRKSCIQAGGTTCWQATESSIVTCPSGMFNSQSACQTSKTPNISCTPSVDVGGCWKPVASAGGGGTGGGGTCASAAKNCSVTCANNENLTTTCAPTFVDCNQWQTQSCSGKGGIKAGTPIASPTSGNNCPNGNCSSTANQCVVIHRCDALNTNGHCIQGSPEIRKGVNSANAQQVANESCKCVQVDVLSGANGTCDTGHIVNGNTSTLLGSSVACPNASTTTCGPVPSPIATTCGGACNINADCPNDHQCSNNKCVLNACMGVNVDCSADKCSVNQPQPTPQVTTLTCGAACGAAGTQCPNGHTCNTGTCKLNACLAAGATCNATKCAVVVAPICLSITASKTTDIKVGDAINFTCGTVANATSYEFRVRAPGGTVTTLTGQATNKNVSEAFTITAAGAHNTQCRVCNGTVCSEWEGWPN